MQAILDQDTMDIVEDGEDIAVEELEEIVQPRLAAFLGGLTGGAGLAYIACMGVGC